MSQAMSQIVSRGTAMCALLNHHRHPLPGSTVSVIPRANSDEVQIGYRYPVKLVYSQGSPSSSLCALAWKHSKNLNSLKARASEVQYDAFLSFSGVDTRFDFTDFLNKDLNNAGIRVFRDKDAIKVGDKIDETILQAIDNSKIYIPIISQTYPNRTWCFIELERMINNVSQLKGSKRIFPIFYKVNPGDVKCWTPRPKNLSSEVKLRVFKEALAKVGQIKGWKVNKGQSQAKIVELVVQKVLDKLCRKDGSQTKHPMELDDLPIT